MIKISHLTNRMFVSENPLFSGQDISPSFLKILFILADFGFTKGYKKTITQNRF